MGIVTTTSLSFAYGQSAECALHEVNIDVPAGEFMLVAGASGSGKSTLLRCINGLIPHFHGGSFSGVVMLDGVDTRQRQPRQLAGIAGMVFQDPEAHKVARTVEEEIVFALENAGASRSLIRRRLEESLDAIGIASLRSRDLATLSGGELQRVAIASVLTQQPKVLLLDEPASQLDPQAADDVLRTVRDLRDDHGVTVIVAEHRLDRFLQHADSVAHVAIDGRVSMLDPREAAQTLAGAPPVSEIGRALDWPSVPLSVAEARRMMNGSRPTAAPSLPPRPARNSGAVAASLRGVSVSLGGRPVLHAFDVRFREGDITFVMGRNGAGKTTLLRTLGGLVPVARGEVAPDPIETRRTHFRDLAYVAQDPGAVLGQPTAAREIDDVLAGTGREASTADALARWGLSALADKDPRDISGGERQRLALAAMLAGDPKLILLDEPTRGMDAVSKDTLVDVLRERRDAGACVIVACHDVELAARCADRIVLLAEGDIIADGPPPDVLTGSITFSTQANKLFGGNVLTVEDALAVARGVGV